MEKQCKNCHTKFEANHGKTLFCSDKCKISYHRNKGAQSESIPESEDRTDLVVTENGAVKEIPTVKRVAERNDVMDKINKDFGPGTIMMFGDRPQKGYDVVSTGSIKLDKALGIGGLPRGRFVEIKGLESGGKTTLCLHVIANAQKKGLRCLIVDAESSFDPDYAANIGVDIDRLMYVQPDFGEQGFETVDRVISSGEVDVVVIDSVAAMIPRAELDGEMGDAKMGLHARLMSQMCRKLSTTVSKHNVLLIFINQLRYKIGVVYGNPETTTGGEALKFYASIRIDIRKAGDIKDGDDSVGNKTRAKIIKNKCAPPMKTVEFDILFGEGIDRTGEIIDLAVDAGVIQKSGSWFSYNGEKLGQGRDNVRELLLDNPDLANEIFGKIAAQ